MRLKRESRSDRYQHFSDEGLVALMSRNDTGALDALYQRIGHLAYGLALKIVGDEQIAQDLVGAAFLKLWQRAPAYKHGSARAQLLAILHQSACDTARRTPRISTAFEEQAEPHAWISLERESAKQALKHLAPDERVAIELAYYAGQSRSQIAAQLALPVETVTRRISSGMNTLRRHSTTDASVLEEAPLDEGETTPTPN